MKTHMLKNINFFSFAAATFDHLPTVVWLVESEHCSVSERAQSGITPVHLAAAKGSLKCLRWMAQHDPRYVPEVKRSPI